ncbi:MAG: FkbM family methyltransferase [Flavobacteriaceae bacterium]|nr:FkbM family methyltransferase [Flavobacteriaceae bacterium]
MKKKNSIYDVGLHEGEDTDFYLKKGFDVVAFEANPDLIQHCKERFASEIQTGQLVIVEGAIVDFDKNVDEVKTVKFFKNKNNNHWGTVVESWAKRNQICHKAPSEMIEVPIINFTECLQKYGVPYYLKIDIEGMDTLCLKSLLKFDEKPDYISIESEKVTFEALEKEFELFEELGYSSFKVVNQATISDQKEPENSEEGKFCNYSFLYGATGLFGKDLPNEWQDKQQTLSKYKKIFMWYQLFGNYGLLKKENSLNKFVFKVIRKIKPSITKARWYDTHAKHSSV